MNTAAQLSFAKGHGTGNDFVILSDPEAATPISAEQVAWLCDRRRGIGGDGILRVVRSGALLDAGEIDSLPEGVERDMWFMDYRNADGSLAEMCGNGVRVFAHWLCTREGVTERSFHIGTRAGVRTVSVHAADELRAEVTVGMGTPEVLGLSTCFIGGQGYAGLGVDMGNPHLACVIPGLTPERLAGLALGSPATIDTDFFPEGVNIEILTELDAEDAVHMRVIERGVGETLSCGTGTVAAARAALADAGREHGSVTVNVPGGQVTVGIEGDNSTLRGPSVILAEGTVRGLPGLTTT